MALLEPSLWMLPAAFGLGLVHALEPGHGKSLVSVYMLGNRAQPKDALLMAITIAVSHTASVALVALAVAAFLQAVPQLHTLLHQSIEVVSGVLVLLVAGFLGFRLLRPVEAIHDDTHCGGCHSHPNPNHANKPTPRSLKDVLLLGVAGGLCPSPMPLVLLLTALATGGLSSMPLALLYLATFSLGLATTVGTLGLLLVGSRQFATTFASLPSGTLSRRFPRFASAFSVLVLTVLGCWMIASGLNHEAEATDQVRRTNPKPVQTVRFSHH